MRDTASTSGGKKVKVTAGVLLLAGGCVIYLFFRSTSIALYKFSCAIGLQNLLEQAREAVSDWQVSDFVRFCIPDGLYCLSYVILMDAIWPGKGVSKTIAVSAIPVAAIVHETLQGFGIVRGTFDSLDLLCYLVPWALYLIQDNIINSIKKIRKL